MLAAFLVLLAPYAAPDDWPCWRGPQRTGVSAETDWTSAGAAEPLWTTEVGRGYSAPSVSGGRLYTRGFLPGEGEAGDDATFCLDAETGEELWVHLQPSKLWDNMHGGGTLTTPTVDGDTVYVLGRMGPLVALDAADGEVRWERALAEELAVSLGPFGLCSSPVVDGAHLILNVGKTVALDKGTGETVWSTRDYGPSYATPAPFVWRGRALLAVFNGAGLAVLDRTSGEEVALFEWTSQYNVNSATPVVIGDEIFISTGYNEKGCALLRLTQGGLEQVWHSRAMNNRMTGCVLVGGHLYGFDDGQLKCVGLDGKELWRERGLGKGALIAADERLIVLSEKGELLVAPASPEGFAPEARTRVFEEGGVCWTMPVLANGRLYLRNSVGTLVCRDHRPGSE